MELSGDRKRDEIRSCRGTGGRDRDRTGDPLLAKQVLSQLSYTPTVIHVPGNQYSLSQGFGSVKDDPCCRCGFGGDRNWLFCAEGPTDGK